jgi:type VI secretion system protein ImpH
MASAKRQSDTPIKDRLFKEFYKFSFFKAVGLLESLFADKKSLGQTLEPNQEAVRFSSKPGLAFPPSDISKLESGSDGGPVNMEVTFMGLVGPAGVLPHWYNELVIERIWNRDRSLAGFLDIFHHRFISLFYLAWKKHRFPENYLSGAKDRLSSYLLSLVGLGTPGLAGMIGLPKESLAFYGGLLSRSVPSAVAIQATVEYFSGTDVRLDQFIERTLLLSPEDRTQLRTANARLGINTVCGSYIWECQTKFRVNLGPLDYNLFLRLLPTGDMLKPIFALIRYMVGIEYEFEIRLILKRKEVPPCILGRKTAPSPRLGWTIWLKSPEVSLADDEHVTFQEPDPLSQ